LYAVVDSVQRWRYRVTALGRTIMQTYYTEAERGQAEADTRLAAAAPELLKALREIMGWREIRQNAGEIPIAEIERIARAAIARATGATP
jgi:hypothetical protein